LTNITQDGDVFSVEANPKLEDVIYFIQEAQNSTETQKVRTSLKQAELAAKCLLIAQNA